MALNQLQVAGAGPYANGTNPTARGGNEGDTIVSQLNGKYYEQTYRGNTFSACTTSAATIGVLTATGVTYHLFNPLGSGYNAVILAASFGPTSATFAVGAVFYAVNAQTTTPSGTTPLTVKSNYVTGGSAATAMFVYSAATLAAAPLAVRPFFAVPATACTNVGLIKDDVSGEIIIGPGNVLSIQASAAAVAVGHIGVSWNEIKVV